MNTTFLNMILSMQHSGKYTTAHIALALRQHTHLTQQQFCEKYNIPERTFQSWEQGKRTPPKYVLSQLAYLVSLDG